VIAERTRSLSGRAQHGLEALRPGQSTVWSITAAAAAMLAGVALRQAVQQGWERTRDERAPLNPAAPGVSWGEALTWALVSGAIVGVGRVVVRRGVAGIWNQQPEASGSWKQDELDV
jgi:hypothetical protein